MVIKAISNLDNDAGKFIDEVTGVNDGTQIEALHLNVNTIDELVNLVEAGGVVCDNTGVTKNQLLTAVNNLINSRGRKFIGVAAKDNTPFTPVGLTGYEAVPAFTLTDGSADVGNFDYFIEMELKITSQRNIGGLSYPQLRWKCSAVSVTTGLAFPYGLNLNTGSGVLSSSLPLLGTFKFPNIAKNASPATISLELNNNNESISLDPFSVYRVYRRPVES
jgi:hypothetical protein